MTCCTPGRPPGEHAGTPPPAARSRTTGLIDLPAARFLMGSDDSLAHPGDGEGPVREVEVAAFAIAPHAVTNAEFAAFVADTGYRTSAEQYGDSLVFAGLLPPDAPPTPAVAAAPWWRVVPGADWRHPEGPRSAIDDRATHPVVHVSHSDALAYCRWAGARLPTEAEWEFAARGGLVQQPFPWGAEFDDHRMNVWRGEFPHRPEGPVGTVPVDSFEPNGFGLLNTTGNVWEWTADTFRAGDPRPVLRGGSYLCHASYCRRYRTSARTANTPDSSTGHAGFRVAA
ncbi:formylglycine-generating enzyme family protein [Amycolatopsis tucumanensis]|uniref:Formylglycine-generating enzyme family protein n=1 Tax=Amycolatopsis tucumanensis TaxID=401106 RepID=A0ABP7HDT9_9PSEU|nr:formylglycine-generating enzyme family protein [Amycolatopsis tucumanensis]MCF6425384.1 formylglycine-generating enzyme family protein [Amycolatopsis tucumanensis]